VCKRTRDSRERDIMGVLRPEQVTKYRRMVEKMHPRALP
jgi:hypothetical protein